MSLRVCARRSRAARGAAGALLASLLLPAVSTGQVPFNQDQPGGARLRDRYKAPQNTQKLSDAVRKLKSDDPQERLEGVSALADVDDPKAVEYLVTAASDPDMRIRVKAIDVLGQVKAKDATPLLIQQLFMRDTDLATKRRILACLGKIGDSRATGPIVDFLGRDVDPAARGNAIFALGDIGDPAAIAPLESIANDGDPALRGLASEAVRKIRARPAPTVVPPALAVDRRAPGAAQTTP